MSSVAGITNGATETLQGEVERLTFHSAETGYTVTRFKVPRASELITVVGSFANIQPGQTLRLTGTWREHPKYGSQFQVTQYQEIKPATLTGIEKYLGSGLIKGVGPVTARRIVAHFGLETLEIIESQIDRLSEVPGIAQKRIKLIQTAWVEQKAIKEVMLFLQSNGVSTTFAVKIYKQYGDESITLVSQNPYQLATDIYGIGFVTADEIARNLGIAPHSEYRYRSGILHVLSEAAEDGHCYLPRAELNTQSTQRLALKDHQPQADQVESLIQSMINDGSLIQENQLDSPCYAPPFYQAETGLRDRLKQLLAIPLPVDTDRVKRWIERFIHTTGQTLTAEQQQAVQMATQERILILTGGPGTGKTFTTRTIVALWKAMGKTIALASPTGRAAQRLSEMTGEEAKTLHRLLEFSPKTMRFQRDAENPITADAIIVDEASMIDLFLANSLIKATSLNTQLLLVGDIDQLPSVGPGSVLADLIHSSRIATLRLTQIFRQAQTSQIIQNAYRINQGQYPNLEPVRNNPQSDCLWLEAPEPEDGVKLLPEVITDYLPEIGFNPIHDVQVLAPMTRGVVGTRNLNQILQAVLNPASPVKPEVARGGMTLRLGDRVIQKVNDYNREVFNGDLGMITGIDLEAQEVEVSYNERPVRYDVADWNEISLAWAVTIHKSQGSEYPVVVMPMYMQHYLMLSRNLLYTGLTRAKQLVILVGQKKALGIAVQRVKDQQRYTLLAMRLR